jgi:hypothetical protein
MSGVLDGLKKVGSKIVTAFALAASALTVAPAFAQQSPEAPWIAATKNGATVKPAASSAFICSEDGDKPSYVQTTATVGGWYIRQDYRINKKGNSFEGEGYTADGSSIRFRGDIRGNSAEVSSIEITGFGTVSGLGQRSEIEDKIIHQTEYFASRALAMAQDCPVMGTKTTYENANVVKIIKPSHQSDYAVAQQGNWCFDIWRDRVEGRNLQTGQTISASGKVFAIGETYQENGRVISNPYAAEDQQLLRFDEIRFNDNQSSNYLIKPGQGTYKANLSGANHQLNEGEIRAALSVVAPRYAMLDAIVKAAQHMFNGTTCDPKTRAPYTCFPSPISPKPQP